MPYRIEIDATKLDLGSFGLSGAIEKYDARLIQSIEFEPGTYSVVAQATFGANWQFEITARGLIDYAAMLDSGQGGFLSGAGTATLIVLGFSITLGGRGLSLISYFLNGITETFVRQDLQQLRLLPGRYQFYQGNNAAVPEADFEVQMGGKAHFEASSDTILKWRDADHTLEIVGSPIALDGRDLDVLIEFLAGYPRWLQSRGLQPLLPGRNVQ